MPLESAKSNGNQIAVQTPKSTIMRAEMTNEMIYAMIKDYDYGNCNIIVSI